MSELEHDALQNITPQSERERRLREQLRLAVMSDSEECKLLTADNERLRAEIERLRAALGSALVALQSRPPPYDTGGVYHFESLASAALEDIRRALEGKREKVG